MKAFFDLDGGKLSACEESDAKVVLYSEPTPDEQLELQERYRIDGHSVASAIDPDELSRLEFDDGFFILIFKKPKSYCADDQFLLRVSSCGIFAFPDQLVVVQSDDAPLFEGRVPFVVKSLQDVILRLIYQAILHFEGHLKAISMLSDSLEKRISTSLENRYLLNMFALEKSLVYIINSIGTNGGLFDRMRGSAAKLGFDEDDIEVLDDISIENKQCFKRAEIYSHVISGLMDARVSIVSNNLNHLIKKFTIVTIAIMLANFVVSLFSMNVAMPFPQERAMWPFWIISVIAFASAFSLFILWRLKKW